MQRFLRRKWLVRFGLFGFALAVCVPVGYWLYVRETGRSRLAETIRKLNESDRGWENDELAAAHNASLPPDDRNSFRLIRETKAALPTDHTIVEPAPWWLKQPANTLPEADERRSLREFLAARAKALTVARRLVDYPEGGRPVVIAEIPIDTDLKEVDDIRSVVWLLQLDALAAADENRPADAVRDIRAIVNAGRAVGAEPVAISQLVRSGCAANACDATERLLGVCEPEDGLAELQAELLLEADFPRLYHSVRAERAAAHQMFLLLKDGKVEGVEDEGLLVRLSPVPLAYRPDDHAFGLEVMSWYVEASRRPFDEQWAALRALPEHGDDEFRRNPRHLYAVLFASSLPRVTESGPRTRGWLLATAAGIACERHRRRTGQWPDSLEAIPKDILPAVPTDPFTGKAITFRRLADGITVYSVGPDGQDDGGRFGEGSDKPEGPKTRDFGIRLWDADQRRQPPPPKPEPEADPAPGNSSEGPDEP